MNSPVSEKRTLLWITGAAGLIGNSLVKVASTLSSSINVRPITRSDFDLTDYRALQQAFYKEQPNIIIHCAAMSKSPECFAQPELAKKVNTDLVRFFCNLAQGSRFVFFSSDLVFDGKKGNYKETDQVNPLSVYGRTKVEAEEFVLAHSNSLIIRTSLNCGISLSGNRGFNEQMKLAWAQGRTLQLFIDEFRSPIFADITARATLELAFSKEKGIFHIAGAERLSRYEIGMLLSQRYYQLKPKIQPTSLKEYKGEPRPADTSLDCSKAMNTITTKLPGFSEWLRDQAPTEF